jgi:hypothetical protein
LSPDDAVFRQALLLGQKNRAGFTLPGENRFSARGFDAVTN